MQLITTTTSLAEVCERLQRHPFVTVDTEFLRESTYYPKLCVAQIASTDEAVVVDALADGIDLKPLFHLMAAENVIKVFTPPARTSRSAGTPLASSRRRWSTPRLLPWCSAMVTRLPMTNWFSASPATASTSHCVSPIGGDGRSPR